MGREGRGQKGGMREEGGTERARERRGTERGEERGGDRKGGREGGEGKERRWLLCLLLRSHERLFLWSHECPPVVLLCLPAVS